MSSFSGRSLIVLLLLGVAACGDEPADTQKQPSSQGEAAVAAKPVQGLDRSHAGTALPAVALTTPGGGTVPLQGDGRRLLLVNLWATWCAPCKVEMPSLDRLAARHGARIEVLPVSQDLQGWEPIERFYAEAGLAALPKRLDAKGALLPAYGATGLPLTILYDAEGREVWRYAGPMEWDSPEALQWLGLDGAS